MIYQTGLEGTKGKSTEIVSCPVHGEVSLEVCNRCNYRVAIETLKDRKGRDKKKQVICNAPLARVVKLLALLPAQPPAPDQTPGSDLSKNPWWKRWRSHG